MSPTVQVPADLWRTIADFFIRITAPCKDCFRGSIHKCWESRCAAHQFRDVAIRISAINNGAIDLPQFLLIEEEILEVLRHAGKPLVSSAMHLNSTNSRVSKFHAIKRLLRRGQIVEKRISPHVRLLSLPTTTTTKEN